MCNFSFENKKYPVAFKYKRPNGKRMLEKVTQRNKEARPLIYTAHKKRKTIMPCRHGVYTKTLPAIGFGTLLD